MPDDSCIFQLLSIVHEIISSLDCNLTIDARGVFLDVPEAFDEVWHEGLLFKLESYGIGGEPLNLFKDYLQERQPRVVLNGQSFSWEAIKFGAPQSSVLGPLLFLIYINDLSDCLSSICKIFADDTSLFSFANDKYVLRDELNSDLKKIGDWAVQWETKFNPDPHKQAQEVHFSNRTNKDSSLSITFNNSKVETISSQKHLGLILNERLNFNEHLESKINKCYKIVGFLKRLSNRRLSRDPFLRIYKSFVRSHLDYGDIVYDKPNNDSFTSKLERVQYKTCLAITGAIQGTSRERLYKEPGLKPLRGRRWVRKLTFFYKIVKGNSPQFLSNYLKGYNNSVYNTRSASQIH